MPDPRTKVFSLTAAALVAAALGMGCAPPKPAAGPSAATGAAADGSLVPHDRAAGLRPSPRPIDAAVFIDVRRFAAVWTPPQAAERVEDGVVAGVANHHFLAADLIARFFASLRASRPDIRRFIIVSPDHFLSGRGAVSVHGRDYATPVGTLASDQEFVAGLVSSTDATLENGAMFEAEHGVGVFAPFIRRGFPEAEIAGIAVQGTMDRVAAKAFGRKLAALADDRTFILVSSDMSHYLSEAQALANDQETIGKLAAFDERFFASAKDGHIDNGVGLVILAGYLEAKGIKPTFRLLDHEISSDYGADRLSTTSYINGFWVK